MPESKPSPVCKAILLADNVIIDALTQKASVIGIIDKFGRIGSGHITRFTAYAQLVGGIGTYNITIEIQDLSDDNVIARSPDVQIGFRDRFHRNSVVIPVPPLHLPHEGEYSVVLCADGNEVDRQQFTVSNLERKEPDADD